MGAWAVEIRRIETGKWSYLPLLLIGDEQEDMVARYLDRGALFALYDGGALKSVAVITDEGGGLCELKDLATWPAEQGKGYATALLEHLFARYAGRFSHMQVGTGENPATLAFYRGRGFADHHRLPGFFLEHYDHPIVEGGVRLRDMICLRRPL